MYIVHYILHISYIWNISNNAKVKPYKYLLLGTVFNDKTQSSAAIETKYITRMILKCWNDLVQINSKIFLR